MTDLRRDELGEQVTLPRDAVVGTWHLRPAAGVPFTVWAEMTAAGRLRVVLNGADIIADLGPTDVELFAGWLVAGPLV